MADVIKMHAMQSLAPNLSHKGPMNIRITMVPAVPKRLEIQISSLVKPNVVLTSPKRGVMENQQKKATKKENHEP